jgi:hypothetical protein
MQRTIDVTVSAALRVVTLLAGMGVTLVPASTRRGSRTIRAGRSACTSARKASTLDWAFRVIGLGQK